MDTNTATIDEFYTAFQQLDYKKMIACYDTEIVFYDPVFELLRGKDVGYMWQLLCTNAKNFSLTYGNIQNLGDDYYTCDWVATYTFSKTGKQVVNKVKANMKIVDGVILEHSDGFSIHKWSKQALGLVGNLFGWNSFFQRKIKNQAKRNLLKFIEQQS